LFSYRSSKFNNINPRMKRFYSLRLSRLSLANAFHFFGFHLQMWISAAEMDRRAIYSLGMKMNSNDSTSTTIIHV
jgi:hypothetical protein